MMGSLAGSFSEDPSDYRCYLPTTGREEVSGPIWQNVSFRIFDRDSELEAHRKETVLDQDVILISWALLLNSYTRSELVSFAELYEPESFQANVEGLTPNASSRRIETRLLRYRLPDQWELQNILANMTPVFKTAHSELGLVNTAIWLSEDPFPCMDKNYRAASFERLEKPVNNNQVSDSFIEFGKIISILGSLRSSAPLVSC